MELILMMAVSGAGKNYYIDHQWVRKPFVLSADDFFMKGDKYVFDAKKLGQAHGACFRETVEMLNSHAILNTDGTVSNSGDQILVINNTNTSIAEVAPYMAAAQAYGAKARIVHLDIDPKIAAARNVHGVSLEIVTKQWARLNETVRALPPWWEIQTYIWSVAKNDYLLPLK